MRRKREKIEIIIEILELCNSGVPKTYLVFKSNLNFKSVNSFLDIMEERGFIERRTSKFWTTNKGRVFLEQAKEVMTTVIHMKAYEN